MKKNQGFTLIEILTVVTILAVLGVAVLVGINPMMQFFKGYDAVRKSDLQEIKIALEAYYEDHGCYPEFITTAPNYNDLAIQQSYFLSQCGPVIEGDEMYGYLDEIPCDPNTGEPYSFYFPLASWDANLKTCPQKFLIYTNLSNAFDPQLLHYSTLGNCNDSYTVSSNMSSYDFVKSCSGTVCPDFYYGFVNGVCTLLSTNDYPYCGPNYCSDDCDGEIYSARKECLPKNLGDQFQL